jgi:hypothetical protein
MPPKRWITRELLRITAFGLLLGVIRWLARPDSSVAGVLSTIWRFASLDAVYVVPIDRIYWAFPAGVLSML